MTTVLIVEDDNTVRETLALNLRAEGYEVGKMHFGHLITVCSSAEEKCPTVFPGVGERAHWPIDDPAKAQGSEKEILQAYRRARDEIERRVTAWVSDQLASG